MLGEETLGGGILGAFIDEESLVTPSTMPFAFFDVDGWIGDDAGLNPGLAFPVFSITGEFGFEARVSFAKFGLTGNFTETDTFTGDIAFPAFTASGTFDQVSLFNANIAFPVFSATGEFGFEANITYPLFSTGGEFFDAEVFSADIAFPAFTAAGSFTDVETFFGDLPFATFTIDHFSAGLSFAAFAFDGVFTEVTTSAKAAYAMNIATSETTRYQNYPFDHLIGIGIKEYGVNSDGIFELTGPTDYDPIAPLPVNGNITTNTLNFGSHRSKRVDYLYLESDTQTKTIPIVDGIEKLPQLSSFNGRKTKLAKGNSGRDWMFRIENIIQVDAMEVLMQGDEKTRQRRVK